jgi:outer membrane lipoprotein SlyB
MQIMPLLLSRLLQSTVTSRLFMSGGALAMALSLGACTTYTGNPTGATEVREGVIETIYATQLQGARHQGVGAVVGGIAGAGLGNLIGRGSGREVATVLGALGGGFLGHEVQQADYDQPIPGQQVIVRTNSGVIVAVTQPINGALYRGARVYLEGSGINARVVPRY